MKDRIVTNSFRSIKKFFPRFLSLLIMSMLGSFVFMGLLSTAPDMIETMDQFLDQGNVYDIRIVSTMGLTKEDCTYLQNLSGIKDVEGVHSKDVLILNEDKIQVLQVMSLPKNINQIKLIEGALPQRKEEIVVEQNMMVQNGYHLGDKVILQNNDFEIKEFIIVGVVDSPLYFNNVGEDPSRGNTTVGTGTINFYSYVLEENFPEDYYSTIYLTVENAKELRTSSSEYVSFIENTLDELKKSQKLREDARYESLYQKAKTEIDENEEKINNELTDAKKKLDEAKLELDKGKTSLNQAYNELMINKKKLEQANKTIESSKKQYQSALESSGIKEENIPSMTEQLNNGIMSLNQILAITPPESESYQEYTQKLSLLKEQLTNLQALDTARESISAGESEYQKNLKLYNNGYALYQQNYNLYQKNLKTYESSLKEYNENKEKAFNEINKAKQKLTEMERPKWLLYDRTDYPTYAEYVDDTKSMSNLAKIFPLVFFAVAILVSLISMNRMVEDDRMEIGTLKSLGFGNRKIINKYLLFSFLATLIGSFLGIVIGNLFIPTIIFSIYKMLFLIPNFVITWDIRTAFLSFLIAFVCICGTTVLTVYKVLKEKPSELMRPKAPKSGKRVFLEKIHFLWGHLKFSNKVTLRNLFRYKKRVFVTVGGIAGCTALILCGFGIKDSIVDLTDMQFGSTFQFDALSYVNDMNATEIRDTFKNDSITDVSLVNSINVNLNKTNITLFVAEDSSELQDIVSLKDSKNKDITISSGSVLVSDKLASLQKINVGEEITLTDLDGNIYSFLVGGIVKNYVEHYVYVLKSDFENLGYPFKPNVVYLKTNQMTKEEQDEMIRTLLENDKIINVSFIESLKVRVSNMLKSLDKVVFILIVLASLLAFVVLYNLSNINIQERKREIATLKVLGFYNKEVDSYITKENIILTIIGIVIGLVLGYFLTNIVITTVEIEKARFIHHIGFMSFFYSAVISCTFTIIVNVVTHFSLKRIDMISSLKSVE